VLAAALEGLTADTQTLTITAGDTPQMYTLQLPTGAIDTTIEGSAIPFAPWRALLGSAEREPIRLELGWEIRKLRQCVRGLLSYPAGNASRIRTRAVLFHTTDGRLEVRIEVGPTDRPPRVAHVSELLATGVPRSLHLQTAVSPRYIDDALRMLAAFGSKRVAVEFRGDRDPIILRGSAGGFAVVMPCVAW
jgi:hypothetical protein